MPRPLIGILACSLIATGAVLAAQSQAPVFRSGTESVSIYATVRGNDGRLVANLEKDDFRVKDDGVVRDVTVFSREIVPITVVVLVDVSGSQQANAAWNRDAAKAFVGALATYDRARVGTFGVELAISGRLTNDKAYLNRILDEEIWPGGSTPLWRATDLAMDSLRGERGRRVVLLLTDGQGEFSPGGGSSGIGGRSSGDPLQLGGGSTTALPYPGGASTSAASARIDAITDRAVREEFMIYAVGRAPTASSKLALTGVMESVALESGGGHRQAAHSEDPNILMTHVAEELHHQYLIGFTPATLDGKVHKLEVTMTRSGMSVRARKSYLASR